MRVVLILSMVAAGICVAIQGPVNARLRLALDSPVFSVAFPFARARSSLLPSWQRARLAELGAEFADYAMRRRDENRGNPATRSAACG
jgi:hypothetical protein